MIEPLSPRPRGTLARRTEQVTPSSTLAIAAKAAELRAQGVDVANFSAGEPDFPTPAAIVDAAKAALDAGQTRYSPAAGLPALRQAVAERLSASLGLAYEPADVVVTAGAKQALFESFAAVLDEGDEALVLAPYWISYPEQVRLVGARPVFVPLGEANGFRPTVRDLFDATTSRTRAIVYSSPCNPTGAVFDDEALAAIADWAAQTGGFVLSDEIYESLVYGGPHRSILHVAPQLRDRVIYIGGLSKSYAMTGWRLGYLAAARDVAEAVAAVQSHVNTNTATFVQAAAVVALRGDQRPVAEMKAAFDARRKLMTQLLAELPGVRLVPPDGAFYCLPNVSAWYGLSIGGVAIRDSVDFARVCLEQAHLAIVPGDGFGAPDHVRFSFACGEETIRAGLGRLRDLLLSHWSEGRP